MEDVEGRISYNLVWNRQRCPQAPGGMPGGGTPTRCPQSCQQHHCSRLRSSPFQPHQLWLVNRSAVNDRLFFLMYIMLLQSLYLLIGENYRALQGAFKSPYCCSPGLGSGGSSPSAARWSSPESSRMQKRCHCHCTQRLLHPFPAAEAIWYYIDICQPPFSFFC